MAFMGSEFSPSASPGMTAGASGPEGGAWGVSRASGNMAAPPPRHSGSPKANPEPMNTDLRNLRRKHEDANPRLSKLAASPPFSREHGVHGCRVLALGEPRNDGRLICKRGVKINLGTPQAIAAQNVHKPNHTHTRLARTSPSPASSAILACASGRRR